MNINEYHKRIENMHSTTGVPTYWAELQDAKAEIERLRALVKELLPFMLEDVVQGMALGKPPFDPNHCDNTPYKCPDCIWFLGSKKWKARIDSGEFSQYEYRRTESP